MYYISSYFHAGSQFNPYFKKILWIKCFIAIISNIFFFFLSPLLLVFQLIACWTAWYYLTGFESCVIFFFHLDCVISVALLSSSVILLPFQIYCWVHLVKISFQLLFFSVLNFQLLLLFFFFFSFHFTVKVSYLFSH